MPYTEAQITAAAQTLRDFVRENTPEDPDDPVRRAFLTIEDHALDWVNARAVMARQARAQDPLRKCMLAADRFEREQDLDRKAQHLAELRTRIQEVKDADKGA